MIRPFIYKLLDKAQAFYWRFSYDSYKNRYDIHKSFRFNGVHIKIYGEGRFKAGKNSYIGSFSTVQVYKGCNIEIGENCRISHNVRIYSQSAVSDQDFKSIDELKIKFGDVIIEDNVWIGANVFINPGIIVGENSIIGANSVVTKDIEPFSIVGGVPAKLIRYKKIGDQETF